jgi:ketosteroid isomerase-like protein
MNVVEFMDRYRDAWQTSDAAKLVALFAPDGCYHNTPFAVQRGHAAIAKYWERTKLQRDIRLTYEILAQRADGGIAHWHVTYQVASEELFGIWAASTGTNLLARKSGDPLPRLVLDGIAVVDLDAAGLCTRLQLWWHSVAEAPA